MRVPKGPPRGSSGTSLPTRALPWHGDGKKTWGRSHVSSSHGAGGTKRRQRVGGSGWRCPCAAGTAPSPAAKRWRGGNPVPAGGSARPQHSPPPVHHGSPAKNGEPVCRTGATQPPPRKASVCQDTGQDLSGATGMSGTSSVRSHLTSGRPLFWLPAPTLPPIPSSRGQRGGRGVPTATPPKNQEGDKSRPVIGTWV